MQQPSFKTTQEPEETSTEDKGLTYSKTKIQLLFLSLWQLLVKLLGALLELRRKPWDLIWFLSQAATVITPVIATTQNLFEVNIWIIAIYIIALLFLGVSQLKREKHYKQLELENKECQTKSCEEILNLLVYELMKELRIDSADKRLTLYGHNNDRLIPLLRKSISPQYSVITEEFCSTTEGALGKLFQTSNLVLEDISPADTEYHNKCIYKTQNKNQSFPTQSAAGVRIDDESGRAVGALYIESAEPKLFDPNIRKKISCSSYWLLIKKWLVTHYKVEPTS